MNAQVDKLMVAVYVVAGSMIVVIGLVLIKMAREGNRMGALMGLAGVLAGIMYEINRWVSYGLIGVIIVLVIIEIQRISRQ